MVLLSDKEQTLKTEEKDRLIRRRRGDKKRESEAVKQRESRLEDVAVLLIHHKSACAAAIDPDCPAVLNCPRSSDVQFTVFSLQTLCQDSLFLHYEEKGSTFSASHVLHTDPVRQK